MIIWTDKAIEAFWQAMPAFKDNISKKQTIIMLDAAVKAQRLEDQQEEIKSLRAENEKLDDTRIDYICKINKLVDEREKLRKALAAILNDVGYHNPMRMTTEISDKVLEDAAGALNDYNI